MAELTLIRGDDIEMELRAIDHATRRLVAAATDAKSGCRWCAARALLREVDEYAQYRCRHTSAVRDLVARVEDFLVDEPRAAAKCRRCLGRRKLASEGESGYGCPTHATCPAHDRGTH